jgi:hypothetical protein
MSREQDKITGKKLGIMLVMLGTSVIPWQSSEARDLRASGRTEMFTVKSVSGASGDADRIVEVESNSGTVQKFRICEKERCGRKRPSIINELTKLEAGKKVAIKSTNALTSDSDTTPWITSLIEIGDNVQVAGIVNVKSNVTVPKNLKNGSFSIYQSITAKNVDNYSRLIVKYCAKDCDDSRVGQITKTASALKKDDKVTVTGRVDMEFSRNIYAMELSGGSGGTPSPVNTPKPVVTTAPVNTPIAVNTPVLVATTVPINTPVPVATTSPSNTPVPIVTTAPVNTPSPVATTPGTTTGTSVKIGNATPPANPDIADEYFTGSFIPFDGTVTTSAKGRILIFRDTDAEMDYAEKNQLDIDPLFLNVSIEASDLSSVQTMIHIHRKNGDILFDLTNAPKNADGSFRVEITPDKTGKTGDDLEDFYDDLEDELWDPDSAGLYVMIHTQKFPKGEVKAFTKPYPELDGLQLRKRRRTIINRRSLLRQFFTSSR